MNAALRRGVILAAGDGTRLSPLTIGTNKQLLPVFDKPQVYYAITTMILAGVKKLSIICKKSDLKSYQDLLADGRQFGISITYSTQESPNGIVGALLELDQEFKDSPIVVALGDNLFHGPSLGESLAEIDNSSGATVIAYRVQDPTKFGVLEFDDEGQIVSIEEKPVSPKSNYAVLGLYFLDSSWALRALEVEPSDRGELEITDLLSSYLSDDSLRARTLPRGSAWFDLGEPEALLEASVYIRTVQTRQGLLVGSPEEASVRRGLISRDEAWQNASKSKSNYFRVLAGILEELA